MERAGRARSEPPLKEAVVETSPERSFLGHSLSLPRWVRPLPAPRKPRKSRKRPWGTFDSTEGAARAYDAADLSRRGSKAKTNFPLEPLTGLPQAACHPSRSDSATKYSVDAAASRGEGTSGNDYYDVYLIYRGADIGSEFVDCLCQSLVDAGIRVFKDEKKPRLGSKAGGHILRAIDSAKIYIPIFSRGYAYSARCLRDLATVVERKVKSGGGKTIIPIFYDVKPCDVRLETPLYREAIVELTERFGSEKVKEWADYVGGTRDIAACLTLSEKSEDSLSS